MSKLVRNLLLFAVALVIAGGIIAGAGAILGGVKSIAFTANGPVILGSDSSDSTKVDESYKDITEVYINLDIGEVKLVEGDSFSLKGSYNPSLIDFKATEKDGVLTIRGKEIRTGFWGLGWNWGFNARNDSTLTLTYPKGTQFESVDITLALGNLESMTLSADSLKVKLSLGNFTGRNITVDSIVADLDLGNCTISDFTVTKQAEITLDAGSLSLKNSSINNLTAKNSLGDLDYSGVLTGTAKCDLDLGSLKMDLDSMESELSYKIKTDLGSVTVNGRNQSSSVSNTAASPKCTLDISLALGSVTLKTR